MSPRPRPRLILLTGAIGCIGGRWVPRLLEAGHRVRCLARDPARLEGREWLPHVEVLVPCLLWVSLAATLNFALWRLNQ